MWYFSFFNLSQNKRIVTYFVNDVLIRCKNLFRNLPSTLKYSSTSFILLGEFLISFIPVEKPRFKTSIAWGFDVNEGCPPILFPFITTGAQWNQGCPKATMTLPNVNLHVATQQGCVITQQGRVVKPREATQREMMNAVSGFSTCMVG